MNARIRCRSMQSLAAACAMLLAGVSAAQDFPARPINIINPIAAGSSPDNHLRILAAELSRTLGQAVTVENRPGGGGRVGINAVLDAPKDGYVLGLGYLGPLVILASDPKFKLEPGKDYTPISLTTDASFILSFSAAGPFRDMPGFIAYAKANPGKLSVSGVSYGSGAHIAFEMIKKEAGIDVVVVNYKGEADSILALARGEVVAGVSSAIVKPAIDSGKVIGIATTGAKRWPVFAALPTLQETGLKNYDISGWYGIVGPAGMPAGVTARLHAAFVNALANPEVRKRVSDTGLTPVGSTPDEFAQRIRADMERIGTIIRTSGIKLE